MDVISARIASIRQATPTVKVFTFTTDRPMEFKAGQWLDLYVQVESGSTEVGGYSMTSSPLRGDHVELAIKYSAENPVTRHLHEHAQVGDELELDGGQGDVYYEAGMASSLVLVAGGIGITPLMSIIRYASEATREVPTTLLYSAPDAAEHVFREELEVLAQQWPLLRCEFWVTRDGPPSPGTLHGRIGPGRLREAVEAHPQALFFVCGPGPMIDEVTAALGALGVPKERVKFERWW